MDVNGHRDIPPDCKRKSFFDAPEQQVTYFKNKNVFLKSIHENARMSMALWSLDGILAWCNEHAWSLAGFTEEGSEGTININSIIPQDMVCHIKEALRNMEGKEPQYRNESTAVLGNNKELCIAWNHYMIRDCGGKEHILSIGIDVTGIKRAGKQPEGEKPGKGESLQSAVKKGLRTAISNEEFFLCYQPLIDIKAKRMVSAEALIRWRHPVKGIISPMEFIPAAEKMGLIIPIGEWVLKTACRQLKEWNDSGCGDFGISVNVSIIQLQQPYFAEVVSRVLEETGLPPKYLELEITENVLIESTHTVARNLNGLKKQGIKISIDDFGTGYSCLEYLQKLSIDSLKIDKTFVYNIKIDVNKAIVEAIISLGHKLNMEITAEGVETEEQYYYLKDKGCDKVQGYYFSKPLLPEELIKVLKAGNGSEGKVNTML